VGAGSPWSGSFSNQRNRLWEKDEEEEEEEEKAGFFSNLL
jgi:hypothetical protein